MHFLLPLAFAGLVAAAPQTLCDPRVNPQCFNPPVCSPTDRTCIPLCDPSVGDCFGLGNPRVSRRHILAARCDPRHEICVIPGGPGSGPGCDIRDPKCWPPVLCDPSVNDCPIIVCPRTNPWCNGGSRSNNKRQSGDCDPRTDPGCSIPGGPGSGSGWPCDPFNDRSCIPPCLGAPGSGSGGDCPIIICPRTNPWCNGGNGSSGSGGRSSGN